MQRSGTGIVGMSGNSYFIVKLFILFLQLLNQKLEIKFMKVLLRLSLSLIVLVVLAAAAVYIQIPYNINTKGMILPVKEWSLARLADGTILNTEKNNLTNKVSYFSVMEFQRGDHAEFIVNERVFNGSGVKKGDTIGYIRSYEEERRLLELAGELEEQRGLLQVYLTGEKPEEVEVAMERVILAEQEYEIQKKFLARAQTLYETDVISEEEWELALNDYQVKRQNMNIARSVGEALGSGSKQEEIDLIKTNIRFFEKQIEQAERRIEAFNILAPFSGTITRQPVPEQIDMESLMSVSDMERMIVRLPVDLYQLDYIDSGNQINLYIDSGRRTYKARVLDMDNTVQFIDQRQNVFITAVVEERPDRFIPNMLVEAEIECGELSAWNYLKRMFIVVFEN